MISLLIDLGTFSLSLQILNLSIGILLILKLRLVSIKDVIKDYFTLFLI